MREHIAHVHVKDAIWNSAKNDADYTYPGEGAGKVREILRDLIQTGYSGALSIEPHVAVVFHDASVKASEEEMRQSFMEYGRRLMRIVDEINIEIKLPHAIASSPRIAATH